MAEITGGGYLLKTDGYVLYARVMKQEPAMKYQKEQDLKDYKFMCFHGKVACSFVCSDRFHGDGLKVTFFDRDWNVLPFERHYPKSQVPISKPINYDKMIAFSEKLSQGTPFVRVDFYEIDGQLYFGEIIFFPGGEFEEFTPESVDKELGSWIKLPKTVGSLSEN